jgi:hypothetical protein
MARRQQPLAIRASTPGRRTGFVVALRYGVAIKFF